ncbi:MAG: tetratricopeptide repeat protein [Myxococcales bacterium]|nr:tetratricopeptide repeat protein [Myxococcales bacterium]
MSRTRLELLDEMIAKGTTDPFVYYARALELRADGALEAALAGLTDLRARTPSYVPTYLMAGQVAETLGRAEVARDFLAAGIEVARAAGDTRALSELRAALDALEP